MKYSFIIPIYNEQCDLRETVDSCLKQKFPNSNFEVVLIDDGSTDNSYRLCKKQFRGIRNVTILHYSTNRGVSYARNYGAEVSSGDILIFLNADEIVPCDFLKKIDKHYKKGADYVYPQTRVLNSKSLYGFYRECYRQYKYNTPNKFLWSQGFSCRREIYFTINGFNEKYPGCGGEDWDFTIKVENLGVNRVVDLSIVVKHKVPEKMHEIIWHMYNRGRGSAYFDLIGKSKNSREYLLKNGINGMIVIVLFVYRPIIFVFFLINSLYQFFDNAFKMFKCSKRKKGFSTIFCMSILDTIIRKISYTITMLCNLW